MGLVGDLERPRGMDDSSWIAISGHLARLRDAEQRRDREHMIGAAKELVESNPG